MTPRLDCASFSLACSFSVVLLAIGISLSFLHILFSGPLAVSMLNAGLLTSRLSVFHLYLPYSLLSPHFVYPLQSYRCPM